MPSRTSTRGALPHLYERPYCYELAFGRSYSLLAVECELIHQWFAQIGHKPSSILELGSGIHSKYQCHFEQLRPQAKWFTADLVGKNSATHTKTDFLGDSFPLGKGVYTTLLPYYLLQTLVTRDYQQPTPEQLRAFMQRIRSRYIAGHLAVIYTPENRVAKRSDADPVKLNKELGTHFANGTPVEVTLKIRFTHKSGAGADHITAHFRQGNMTHKVKFAPFIYA